MGLLDGRQCLVTGASRGLGAAIAERLWAEGASLLLTSRRNGGLDAVRARLTPRPDSEVHAVEADFARPDAAALVLDEARRRFGGIDVLVNNAAIQGPVGPAAAVDWDAWVETLQVDLLAPVALSRGVVPWMTARGAGRIINISGGGATASRPNFSAYATAKTGLVRFTEILASECRGTGITVNAVAPGAMRTAMTDAVIAAGADASGEPEYRSALRLRDEGDGATVERASALCAFLASDAARSISGRLISALWDPWEILPDRLAGAEGSDIYTLRRIVPKDRGLSWGDKT